MDNELAKRLRVYALNSSPSVARDLIAAAEALTAQQEPVAWMWLEGTELLNGTEVEQFERVEFSREKPDYDAYGLTPLYTAPPSGVQPADGRASMQAELGAALGSALSHYKSGDMQACAASLVRIVDLFRDAAKEPK